MVEFTGPVRVPAEEVVVTTPERTITAALDVDLTRVRNVLLIAGWVGADKVDLGQAIATAEAGGKDTSTGQPYVFSDAVGDTTVIDPRYHASIGMFQIRGLRHPMSWWNTPDVWRYPWALRIPIYNAMAAWAISKGGTDFTPWSVFRNNSHTQYLGGDPVIRTGHSRAGSWTL